MKTSIYLWLFLATTVWAEHSDLTGKIVNKQHIGLNQVVVKIKDSSRRTTTTDATGQFSFSDVSHEQLEIDIEISASQHYNTTINYQGDFVLIDVDALQLDDLVISAVPLEHSLLEMTTPAAILSEEELVTLRGTSLDQTINQIPGVNSGSFGTGAGQIVIRGQQGPRVTILNNSQTIQDASRVSPDHWITAEPLLAKQIEVLKGPATLLYGGGAIGGVVNVVDDVVPTAKIQGIQGAVEGRFSDAALGERAGVFTLDAGLSEQIMGHLSYFNTRTDDYEIPGFAESEILHEAEGHEEDDHEDGHEEEAAFGLLENSSIESDGVNFGISWVHDQGYWGMSYADFNRNYGIPGHEHAHDEHDDEDHDDRPALKNEDEEQEEVVRLDMNKSVFTLKGAHSFSGAQFIDQIRTDYSDTDYRHVEFEGDDNGTVFDNQANEFRFELAHQLFAGWQGIAGVQYTNRDFSAIGEEAFILPSTTQTWSLFLVEEREFDGWHGEFGLRFEDQQVETALFNDIGDEAFSLSIGAAINLNDQWTLPVNLSSAQRLPTAEEYFSNQSGSNELVTHLATSLIEVGDLNLIHETANNLDIGLKYRHDNWRFNLALFYNQIDDYIFLRNTGTFFAETPIFRYAQQNATFRGYEIDFEYELNVSTNQQWRFYWFADGTRAELNTNEPVPRIPADRMGGRISWASGAWSAGIDAIHVRSQNELAQLELPTNGYDLLNFNVNWLYQGARVETLVFLKGSNMLDEEIRDHASFIKDIAPRPGRSITAGFRMSF